MSVSSGYCCPPVLCKLSAAVLFGKSVAGRLVVSVSKCRLAFGLVAGELTDPACMS